MNNPFDPNNSSAANALGAWPTPGTAVNPFDFWKNRQADARRYESQQLPAEISKVLETPLAWFKEDALRQPLSSESPLTQVAFVLDKSGSMETGKNITIEGFNTQLKVVNDGAKEAGETVMTFTQFSDVVEVGYVAQGLSVVQPLTLQSYRPGGYTALYDGIGDTLAALLRQPRISSAACATLVTIFTDGEENASRRYTAAQLRDLIQKLEATGRWTFALVGPKQGVGALADLLAVDRSNITGFNPESVHSRGQVMGMMAAASTNYMCMRSMGSSQVKGLYAGDADGND